MELLNLTAVSMGEKIRRGEISSMEAVDYVYAQMQEVEKDLGSFISKDRDYAMKRARAVQLQLMMGRDLGPLAGVPVAVKDNICVRGMRTTCGSKLLENFVPTYSAEVVSRLEAAGAVIIGKTNMDEFAMGSTTETSFFGPTKNPWNRDYSAGGSSGGSAAAVAAGECFLALGSDTGGSIRQPASFCGVTGIKPTYGRVSRYGLVAYASSLDQIGPITKDVTDGAVVLDIISGIDPKDSTSLARSEGSFTEALGEDVKGLRIGIPKEYFGDELQAEVKELILKAAHQLEEAGAVLIPCSLEDLKYAVAAYYVISSAQASSNLARFDGVKYGYRAEECTELHEMYKKTRTEGFGPEAKRRIMLGTFALSAGYYEAYYLKALKVQKRIQAAFEKAFESFDMILAPAAPETAPKIGAYTEDPMKMYLRDLYTVCANMAGIPAISIPVGLDKNGMPVGMQLMANRFQEKTLLRTAYTYECITGRKHVMPSKMALIGGIRRKERLWKNSTNPS